MIFDDGDGKPLKLDTAIYDRALLKAGNKFRGPAIVEQPDTTTLVLPDLDAQIDTAGNILITGTVNADAAANNQTGALLNLYEYWQVVHGSKYSESN